MEKEVKALVPYGFGLNCDHETKYAFELAGAVADRVHLRDIYDRKISIFDYDIIAFIGGFHSGDENGAGVKWAHDFKSRLGDDLVRFVIDEGKLVEGICNGYQAVIKMGLLPGIDGDYDNRIMSVTYNDCGNFRDQWVTLKVNPDSPCVFTKGIDHIDLPIRHGEGKVIPKDDGLLEKLFDANQIAMQYCIWQTQELAQGRFPDNPNASVMDMAGICDPTGRVFGLMPHPESYNHFMNHPLATKKIYELRKSNDSIESQEGLGIRLFRNAVEYIRKNHH